MAGDNPATTSCIFDNTASDAAAANALRLQAMWRETGGNDAPAR